MKMEEEKTENGDLTKSPDKKKEVHYHYHMDEKPGPAGPVTTEKKPGETHYHYYYEPPRMRKPRSSKPTIAGVLLLIQAIMSVIAVVFLIGAGMFLGNPGDGFMFFGGEETADITGSVISFDDGLAVENATITIVGTDLTTTTNAQGEYLIYNAPVGNQKIQVEKEGYNTMIRKVFIEPSNLNMEIDPNDLSKNDEDFILTNGDDVIEDGEYPPWDLIRNLVLVCGVVLVILTILVILGAYASFKRENFRLAIVGAVAGILTLGLFAFIALFILLLAKDEFKKSQKDTPSQGPLGGE
jgi:hypothetical protein